MKLKGWRKKQKRRIQYFYISVMQHAVVVPEITILVSMVVCEMSRCILKKRIWTSVGAV